MSEKSNLRYMFVFEIINIDRSLCGILGLIYGAIMSYVMICVLEWRSRGDNVGSGYGAVETTRCTRRLDASP